MIPAHALFSKAANSKFQDDSRIAGRLRASIEEYEDTQKFTVEYPVPITLDSGNEMWLPKEMVSPGHPLLIGYRYKYRSSDYEREGFPEHRKFLNDAAFLPFEANQRQEAEKMQKNLFHQKLQCSQIRITDLIDLRHCHATRARIEVKGFKGRLDSSFTEVIEREMNRDRDENGEIGNESQGLRLRFVLTDRNQ